MQINVNLFSALFFWKFAVFHTIFHFFPSLHQIPWIKWHLHTHIMFQFLESIIGKTPMHFTHAKLKLTKKMMSTLYYANDSTIDLMSSSGQQLWDWLHFFQNTKITLILEINQCFQSDLCHDTTTHLTSYWVIIIH